MLFHLDDAYLKPEYIRVFSYPFALSILISDFSKILHVNG